MLCSRKEVNKRYPMSIRSTIKAEDRPPIINLKEETVHAH